MNKFIFSVTSLVIFLLFNVSANTLIDNQSLNYRCYLPSGWTMTIEDDSTHSFSDTSSSSNYGAICFITRYSLDGQTPQDWTRSFFIAQKMIYEYSLYYFSEVIYFDSSANAKQQAAWAPEIFARCYSSDTNTYAWNEYIFYTAINDYGYEFLVLGDTTDIETNIDYYSNFLHSIIINNGLSASSNFLLSDLELSPAISLTPSFTPSISSYTAAVGLNFDKISLRPVADNSQAIIKVQNNTVNSGSTVSDIPLNVGLNTISINVTAPDNISVKTYTLFIDRLSADISVKHPMIRKTISNSSAIRAYDLRGKKLNPNLIEKTSGFAHGMYIYHKSNTAQELKTFLK